MHVHPYVEALFRQSSVLVVADKGYGWETCFVDLVGFFFLKFLVFGRAAMHGSPWAETLLRYFGFLFLAGGLIAGQGHVCIRGIELLYTAVDYYYYFYDYYVLFLSFRRSFIRSFGQVTLSVVGGWSF